MAPMLMAGANQGEVSPQAFQHRAYTDHFDRVTAIVTERFNAAGLEYGNHARLGYPVRRDDIFSPAVRGGMNTQPAEDCRGLLAYLIANHIPLHDDFRGTDRLATYTLIGDYFGRDKSTARHMIGRGCRLITDQRFKAILIGSLLRIVSEGITTWNEPKAIRRGTCQ